ncbi:hypothetical protein PZA11_006493 [Diplocarpon coronariae]|uniref:Late sexual development protein n=1 Tax=Diplocarpon coronariae TaxID=2795749 RepID=A0A218ZB22_9HELO|nr:hypothetical protein JHW43_007762 [Diplocarpon mali]OWP05281.1 late sexual development protein [Marssonina coronariae]
MLFLLLLGLSYVALSAAAPFTFGSNPVGNDFPNPSAPQVLDIQRQAHGSLPNGAPPARVADDTLTSLRLVAFNEMFEVAYFTSLLNNITTNATGYTFANPADRASALAALTAVQAQEELHVLNANGALMHFHQAPVRPCQYVFPVSDFPSAIALAATFTDVVLGTLQDVAAQLAASGDGDLIRGITSVIGQEGEQNGFYRVVQRQLPSALPFLTTATREFAFSALHQAFVVPGSCDAASLAAIALPIFGALAVETAPVAARPQLLDFSIGLQSSPGAIWTAQVGEAYQALSLVYVNQQNTPVVRPMANVRVTADRVRFQADFPYDAGTFGNGLTIAVLARSDGALADVKGVAQATVFGPGLIEIN